MENKKHILYIDESNILSKTGHSVYVSLFIIYLNKNNISKNIIDIEKELKISYLHWVDMPWKLRVKFSEKIKNLNFLYKVVVYKNPIIQDKTLECFLSEIINFEDDVIKIIIDGKKGKEYGERLKNELKNKGIFVKNLMFVDDKKESLIRLADFMAGLTRSHIDDKNKYNTHMFNLLKYKIK
jgi:hypothetical protein